jgi:hypothetical protein
MSDKATTYKAFAKDFADEDRGGRFKEVNKTTVMSCWIRPTRITFMRRIQQSGICCNSIVM